MAITGKFVADFSDFDRGVQGAGAKLLSFEAAADKAGGRLMDLGVKGHDASPKIGGLASSLRTFDGALASMGIRIGPEIRALGELGEASGKTATQLGLVTTAGFALAAGIGGWKIGRLIADFTGSDKAIGDMVATMMGWTDTAQRAGAKADVLALASKNAGREITSFSEAMKINAAAAAAQSLQWGQSANAARDTAAAVAGWQREIREVRREGNIAQLTVDLDSQNFTLKELGVKYGISVTALGYFQKAQKDTAAEVKATTAAHEAQAKAVRDYYNWVGERVIQHEATVQAALVREATALRAFYNEMGVLAMNAWKPEPVVDWIEVVGDAAVAAATVPDALAPAEASLISLGASAQQAAGGFFSMSAELYSAIRAGQAMDLANRDRRMAAGSFDLHGRPAIPMFASGGPVLQDGPIYAHAGEYVVPKGGGGGGGVTVNVYGNVLSTKAELARLVKDALATTHMSGGGRMPA